MTWSERQRAMLQGMGLRIWTPVAPAPSPVPLQAPSTHPTAPPDATAPADSSGLRRRTAATPVAVAPFADRPPTDRSPPAGPASAEQAVPTGRTSGPVAAMAVTTGRPETRPAPAADAVDAEHRARDIAMLDWPALRQAAADCRACGLCAERRQTVFGVGHPRAHWMVVGEAPGEQEDLKGEPFVGPSGELLDAMLRSIGLSRAEDGPATAAQRVYIANTVKCRPPRNRNPAADEMACCEPFLVRQIQLVQPRIILAMGRFSVQALLRTTEPIGRLRGRVHRYQGVPLIVTYHPAYLLRNLPEKARAWDDLCLAADTAALLAG